MKEKEGRSEGEEEKEKFVILTSLNVPAHLLEELL